ncbi:tRNA dimethylallyltransferase 2 [Linum grandiflorum]
MDGDAPAATLQNLSLQSEVPATKRESLQEQKPKVVVIMGATGAGKSKLAVDLAAHFPIEIINADSMQVYRGLDVITNKVPVDEQKGVPHHLLGTVNPNVEFTAKEFRDSALPIINDIRSRNRLPVVVGGTNYYIQALVSSFLLDETAEDDIPDEETNHVMTESVGESFRCDYEYLRAVDPVAADRIHPNNYRKINQYLNLYARSGVLPSRVYQGKAAENWGRVDSCRFDCCFICVDASVSVLDRYVDHRVDCMIDAGLLDEVHEIYNTKADYTRGLRQAIGVREFEEFLRFHHSEQLNQKTVNTNLSEVLHSTDDNPLKILLTEAIAKVKLNTRRLVRRQKRMHTRLQKLFGWNIHYVDATEAMSCKSDDSWTTQVLGPAVQIVESFLDKEGTLPVRDCTTDGATTTTIERDLWTQYTCKVWFKVSRSGLNFRNTYDIVVCYVEQACGDKVLRGAHEWEQHKQGRGHRKRISKLRKSRGPHQVLG